MRINTVTARERRPALPGPVKQRHGAGRVLRTAVLLGTLLLAACAQVPVGPASGPPSHALEDSTGTAWGRQFDTAQARQGLSGLRVLQAGVDGLAARVQLIRQAERTLDLQYFIFRGDASGSLLTAELRRAAERGVRVRLLVDDGDTVAGDEVVLRLDGYHDMQVRVFNPFDYRGHNRVLRNLDFVLHKSRLDYRMHNKLLVADNAIALAGGRNVGDQYFQIDPDSQFADDDVFTVGAAVQNLSKAFDQFWNSDIAVPAARLPAIRPGRRAPPATFSDEWRARVESGEPLRGLLKGTQPLTWSKTQVLYDSPDKRRIEQNQQRGRLMSENVEKRIENAHHDLVLVSPYFVPSDHELQLLLDARSRGVEVSVLTNSLETNPEVAAHSGYQKVRMALLQAGAHVFEVRARLDSVKGSGQGRHISGLGNFALHGKMYVFDRQQAMLGSWNYDQRSLRINTEIGLMIDSPVIAGEVRHRFDDLSQPEAAYEVVLVAGATGAPHPEWHLRTDGQAVTLASEPSKTLWHKVKAKILILLPLQQEL